MHSPVPSISPRSADSCLGFNGMEHTLGINQLLDDCKNPVHRETPDPPLGVCVATIVACSGPLRHSVCPLGDDAEYLSQWIQIRIYSFD